MYTYGSSKIRLVFCQKCQQYRPTTHPCVPVDEPEDDG